jgi:hypothetical protein
MLEVAITIIARTIDHPEDHDADETDYIYLTKRWVDVLEHVIAVHDSDNAQDEFQTWECWVRSMTRPKEMYAIKVYQSGWVKLSRNTTQAIIKEVS